MCDNNITLKRIRKLIDDSKKTREEIAKSEELQCDTSTITKHYNGDRSISSEYIVKYAKYFRVSSDYLLGLSDIPTIDEDINRVYKYIGLSEKAVENLRLYNRLKLSREKCGHFFANNDKARESNYCYEIDIISYFIEHLHEFDILTHLNQLATVSLDNTNNFEIEDEILDNNYELYHKIYTHGTVLIGYSYVDFLEQLIVREFSRMVNDFRTDTNPFEDEHIIKFGDNSKRSSLLTLVENDEELTRDYINGKISLDAPEEEGADDGNNPKTQ
ncbi:MAG: helix-turn-helix transcriptional regulator [Ruminococcus sp.]|nr:helix-turn-helix transcriptional regulator [Ruminococcus sp.]